MEGFLFQAFIYLTAAVIAVPIAKRLGLGSVLGYLIAGVVIGPLLNLVGTETQDLQHFAEFGVVMMLFLVGLELEPRALWDMRAKLVGLGGFQVGLTAAAVMAIGMLLGQPWTVAMAIGFVFALSSTAIVLQTLNEKGLLKSHGGQASFSVLLFQDIAVIPMLALIPLLAIPELVEHLHDGDHGHGASYNLLEGLPGWAVALGTLGAIGTVVVGGHYLSRPLFRFIAAAELREVFTAAGLFLVISIALLMTLVGLSPALGTFLAGVVLANSEFRHELESDIEPFKGLLLGLFFITVGAGIDFGLLFADFGTIFGLTLGLMALKAIILLILSFMFKVKGSDRYLFALGLAQAGEFGFVLLSFTVQNGVIPTELASTLLLVVALSMILTPLLFILFERVILRKMDQGQGQEADDITEQGSAIIAGHGRFGQVVNRVLLGRGFKTVVLDYKADLIEGMRRFGVKTYFGDATRPDLLHAAGLHGAKLLVVAIDDKEKALELIKHARRDNPNIHIIARAFDRHHVYQCFQAGANDIVREMFDSSVRAARYALEAYGVHAYDSEKIATAYEEHDKAGLRRLASLWREGVATRDNPEYIEAAKEVAREWDRAMMGDGGHQHDKATRGWMTPGGRADEPAEPE